MSTPPWEQRWDPRPEPRVNRTHDPPKHRSARRTRPFLLPQTVALSVSEVRGGLRGHGAGRGRSGKWPILQNRGICAVTSGETRSWRVETEIRKRPVTRMRSRQDGCFWGRGGRRPRPHHNPPRSSPHAAAGRSGRARPEPGVSWPPRGRDAPARGQPGPSRCPPLGQDTATLAVFPLPANAPMPVSRGFFGQHGRRAGGPPLSCDASPSRTRAVTWLARDPERGRRERGDACGPPGPLLAVGFGLCGRTRASRAPSGGPRPRHEEGHPMSGRKRLDPLSTCHSWGGVPQSSSPVPASRVALSCV